MNKLSEYVPNDMEAERASNGYLMSLIAAMAGLPLPIINLIASLIFYFGNRKGTYYVRWHCTQTLISQFTLLIVNSIGFSWTMAIMFGDHDISNGYIGYIVTILLFNAVEFIASIVAAIRTRKGVHVEWWFSGALANIACKN
jgi:uncharacterized Tic20 family protein